jgi:hypothetical protein
MATRITLKKGITLNLGNYESLRLDVGIEMDVPKGKTIEDAYEDADDLLRRELQGQVDKWDLKTEIEIQ